MFRTHGRPDLLREEEAIDELGARVRRVRRAALYGVIGFSLLMAAFVAWVAAEYGSHTLGAAITGKAIGMLTVGALFGTMFGGQALAAQLVLRWAESLARATARDRRCDEEPLLDAARLFSGGRDATSPESDPPPRGAVRRRHRASRR
jgi:autotransporter translocation and assembly factor TamB